MSTDQKPTTKSEFMKLNMNPTADKIKKYNRDLDIIMQQNFKCNCFTKNDISAAHNPITQKEIAEVLGLDIKKDIDEINTYVRKARDRAIQQLDKMYDDKIKMLATVRSTISDEVLNVLENSSGYDEIELEKDAYKLYQFTIDIIYYKINTNAHIKTTGDLVLEIYNIKQGPTEELLHYQHRAIAANEMIKRTQLRHTKFLLEVKRADENIIPGTTMVMYVVLRGLNDNHTAFKMDVANRMQHLKGDLPYADISDMLNHAAEFHSISTNKGKALISFASDRMTKNDTATICTHCKGTHNSDKCWSKYPSLKPHFKHNHKSITAHKAEST